MNWVGRNIKKYGKVPLQDPHFFSNENENKDRACATDRQFALCDWTFRYLSLACGGAPCVWVMSNQWRPFGRLHCCDPLHLVLLRIHLWCTCKGLNYSAIREMRLQKWPTTILTQWFMNTYKNTLKNCAFSAFIMCLEMYFVHFSWRFYALKIRQGTFAHLQLLRLYWTNQKCVIVTFHDRFTYY